MQTFLPYADFARSVATLDYMRLGKQRVETFQVLQRLVGVRLITSEKRPSGKFRRINLSPPGTPEDEIEWEIEPILKKIDFPKDEWQREAIETNGWTRHPVVRMWRGHELKLLEYQDATCKEWMSRGYKDTCLEKSNFLMETSFTGDPAEAARPPSWLGNEEVHRTHRSNLLRKTHTMTPEQERRSHVASDHYDRYFGDEPDDLEYLWPVTAEEALDK